MSTPGENSGRRSEGPPAKVSREMASRLRRAAADRQSLDLAKALRLIEIVLGDRYRRQQHHLPVGLLAFSQEPDERIERPSPAGRIAGRSYRSSFLP